MIDGHKVIALCIAKAGNERNYEFIRGLNKAVIRHGYRLFVYQTCSDLYWNTKGEEGEKAVFELIDYEVTDAVIIFEESIKDKTVVDHIVSESNNKQVPAICIGRERTDCVSFVFDYEKGFEEIVRHVVEFHGARKLCFIAGFKDEPISERRIEVYKRVLAENNIQFSEDTLFYGDYWWGPTQTAAEKIIASNDMPQAIICANDMMAVTVCNVLKNNGYRVPEDVIVTGFDGIWEALSATPPITTGGCSIEDAADKIVSVINGLFRGETPELLNTIPYEAAIYHSCGCDVPAPTLNIGERLEKVESRFIRYQEDVRSLYELNEKIMSCDTPENLSRLLGTFDFYDICVVVKSECVDSVINPMDCDEHRGFGENMYILHRNQEESGTILKALRFKDRLPDMDYYISRENPIVFSTLSYNGAPLGYVCMNFDVTVDNYCKILQFVSSINNSLGSYLMVRYLKYTAESIKNMSKYDFLTGLLNRKWFYEMLPDITEKAKKLSKNILVAILDMDDLKYINDNFGHEEGDFAIKTVADAIESLPFDDKICGRFGGDEFVVCAVSSGAEDEQQLIKFIKDYINNVNEESCKQYKISASIGVQISETSGFEFGKALKQSDDNMYIMKIGQPNRRKR